MRTPRILSSCCEAISVPFMLIRITSERLTFLVK